mgnify:FL=1
MFNCQVVNHLFTDDFLQSIKALSPHPIIKVPVRSSGGITTCTPQRCYWNSNIMMQTFGGDVVYGFIVDPAVTDRQKGSVYLLGHGCWLNPEGELVDVSPREDKTITHRYFLPVDRKLVLNGVATEQIKNYLYVQKVDSIMFDMSIKASHHTDYLLFSPPLCKKSESSHPYVTVDMFDGIEGESLKDKVDNKYSKFIGKLIQINAWPLDFVRNYLEVVRSGFSDTDPKKFDKKFWRDVANTFVPMVREVSKYQEDIVSVCDGRREFQPFIWECIFEAMSKGKTIFDIAGSYEISELLGNHPKDATWSSGTMVDFCSKNPSTATGKFIQDYVPRSLGSHKLPKKRSKKKKLEKTANKFGLTQEEALLLSDPFLFPHPYIVKKTGLGSEKFPVFSRI